jgi:hypothetical protein
MAKPAKLGNQAIGAAGELFVQYQLIKSGIDSARLTTDSGIDLYIPGTRRGAFYGVPAGATRFQVGQPSVVKAASDGKMVTVCGPGRFPS